MAAVPSRQGGEYEQPSACVAPTRRCCRPPAPGARATPLGDRQLLSLGDRAFVLEGGGVLRDVTIAYETWGTLDARRVERRPRLPRPHRRQPRRRAARRRATPRRAGGTASSARAGRIDTDRWFVVCANVLGGCQGTTGPASPHPDDGKP